MEGLHILLTPNKEHKKVFPKGPVVEFQNSKSLEDHFTEATLHRLSKSGRYETCGKKSCVVCDSISTAATFTKEACQETFKIRRGLLCCDSEKILYLSKYKSCGEAPFVSKANLKFRDKCNSYKIKYRALRKSNRKVRQKLFRTHYCLESHSSIDNWDFLFFEQCETDAQLKERETFLATLTENLSSDRSK